ncbi:MAG: hypothetical protein WBV74_09940 [Pseudonocardiaceae bacterium]
MEQLIRRRETGEPLKQIVGCVNFGGLRLAVGAPGLRAAAALPTAPPHLCPARASSTGASAARGVRWYEPAQALFGGHDKLDHVRELVHGARPWLAPDARVLMELHSGQQEAAAAHAEHTGFSTRRHDGCDGQTTVLDLCLA